MLIHRPGQDNDAGAALAPMATLNAVVERSVRMELPHGVAIRTRRSGFVFIRFHSIVPR